MSTLVLVAHADDETLGAGGWIHQLITAEARCEVLVICAPTDGRQTDEHFAKAMARLGVTDYAVGTIEDQTLAQWATKSIATADVTRYGRVISHSTADLNDDHRKVAEAAMVLTRPPWRGELYSMYIPSSTEWALGQFGNFQPNTFIELGEDDLRAKQAAFAAYTTEQHPEHLPRNPDGLEVLARYWGHVAGVTYAEPFQLIKAVR